MKRIERLLGVLDRFQQRHSVLGLPFGVVKKYGDDRAGRHAGAAAHAALTGSPGRLGAHPRARVPYGDTRGQESPEPMEGLE